MEENGVKCPKCGSQQITAHKKGFSGTKAAGGVLLTGGIGLLAGLHGSSDIQASCLNCGKSWNPKQLLEQKQREAAQLKAQEHDKWKQSFYKAYRKKDFVKAEEVYTSKYVFSNSIPDIHKAFKESRKMDLIGAFLVMEFRQHSFGCLCGYYLKQLLNFLFVRACSSYCYSFWTYSFVEKKIHERQARPSEGNL